MQALDKAVPNTLYGHPVSGNCLGAYCYIADKGLKIQASFLDILKGKQMAPWFLALNPTHGVPTLCDADGNGVWESSVVLRKLGGLAGEKYNDKIGMAMDFRQTSMYKFCAMVYAPYLFGMGDEKTIPEGVKGLKEKIEPTLINFFLKDSMFIGGDVPCIADYSIVPVLTMLPPYWEVADPRISKYMEDFKKASKSFATQGAMQTGFIQSIVDKKKAAAAAAAVDGTKNLEVGYWHIRGLGAPCRMMCEYAGAKYEAKTYPVTGEAHKWDKSSWFDAKPALKSINAFQNLPYVKEGGKIITQTNACIGYLGRKFDLMGSTPDEVAMVEQVLCQTMDLRNAAVGFFYGGKPEGIKGYLKTASGHYDKFESWLSQVGKAFSAADRPLAGDFHLWEMLDQHIELCRAFKEADLLATRPLLSKFYKTFAALPKMQGYLKGPLHKLPINNRMAMWGGEADSSKYGKSATF